MYWVYQDSRTPAPKSNRKLEMLLVGICSLKQKTTQILPATIEKIKLYLSRKQSMVSLNNRLPWGNVIFRIFRIRGKFRTCQTSAMQRFAKIVDGYNYFCII